MKKDQAAAVVRRILAYFAGGASARDDEDRWKEVAGIRGTASEAWGDLGDQLLKWPDDLDRLLRDYVSRNPGDFGAKP